MVGPVAPKDDGKEGSAGRNMAVDTRNPQSSPPPEGVFWEISAWPMKDMS